MSVLKAKDPVTGEWLPVGSGSGGSSGSGANTLTVTIENVVASHTSAEIYAHVQAGGTAVLDRDGYTFVLVGSAADYATFEHSYDDDLRDNILVYDDGSVEYREYYSLKSSTLNEKITRPTTAKVGQTIVVKAVEADGKPAVWEAADLPSGGGSSGIIVAVFETFDDGKMRCTTHSATYLQQCLFDRIPVLAIVDDNTWQEVKTAVCWLTGSGQSLRVGCWGADCGWNHAFDHEDCYADGNTSNKTIGNELWVEY